MATIAAVIPGQLFAATAVSGSMNIKVDASIADGAKTATDSDASSYVGAPQVMAVFAVATATDGVTGGLLTAIAQGQSSGTANAGSVHFSSYGWTYGAPNPADRVQQLNLNDHAAGPDWSYTFIADHAGTINIGYDVFVTDGSDPFGLQGWTIGWTGTGGGLLPTGTPFDPTTSGVFSRTLVGGQTYTVSLSNGANVSTAGNFGVADPIQRMSGTFVYTIFDSAVPEPATWALMVFGVGLVGAARRRRPASAATAG